MPRPLRIALSVLAACLTVALLPWGLFLAVGESPAGLRVDAEPFSRTSTPRAELDRRARRWGARELTVESDDVLHRVPRARLGAEVAVGAMLARILEIGRSGNPVVDLAELFSTWSGGTDLIWEVRVEEAQVRAFVDELAHEVDRPARPARVAAGRLVELSADGARLDREGAVGAILAAIRAGRTVAHVPVERIRSGLGAAPVEPEPRARPPEVILSRYSTDFASRGSERPRAHNVALAASFLDGAVIPAHGELSFNTRVGARSAERGYRLAHVIIDGEMVDGLGGGVCQVASTLHAAAFLAGFDIAEHVPHSRPSAYIPMGLDATVAWPNVDLVLTNPHAFAVSVSARAEQGQMVVELRGARRGHRVEWSRQTVETEDWSDRYVEDPEVTVGERVSQRPIRGFVIVRDRTIFDARGRVHFEERRIRYPPTDRVIRVPLGTLDPYTGEPISRAVPANPF